MRVHNAAVAGAQFIVYTHSDEDLIKKIQGMTRLAGRLRLDYASQKASDLINIFGGIIGQNYLKQIKNHFNDQFLHARKEDSNNV